MVYSTLPLLIISFNFLLQNLRQSIINYTNAYGLYWYTRWKPLFESVINLAVSWSLVKYTSLNISGVLIGTITSNLLVNFIWESWIVLHYGLKTNVRKFLVLYFSYIFTGGVVIFIAVYLTKEYSSNLLVNGIVISVFSEVIAIALFILVNRLFYPRNINSFDIKKLIFKSKN